MAIIRLCNVVTGKCCLLHVAVNFKCIPWQSRRIKTCVYYFPWWYVDVNSVSATPTLPPPHLKIAYLRTTTKATTTLPSARRRGTVIVPGATATVTWPWVGLVTTVRCRVKWGGLVMAGTVSSLDCPAAPVIWASTWPPATSTWPAPRPPVISRVWGWLSWGRSSCTPCWGPAPGTPGTLGTGTGSSQTPQAPPPPPPPPSFIVPRWVVWVMLLFVLMCTAIPTKYPGDENRTKYHFNKHCTGRDAKFN